MGALYELLRNSDHTGERRCLPCTAVNAAVLLLACLGVARRRSRSVAAALGLGGAAAIALRGYLVPLTPQFAPRLVAQLPVDPIHAADPRAGADRHAGDACESDAPDAPGSLGGDAEEVTGEQVLAALVESGVVTADEASVYLLPEFREAWRSEMEHLRERNHEGLANALQTVTPDGTQVDVVKRNADWRPGAEDDPWFVVSDGSGDPARENWLTRPVAVAETAAVWVLNDRTTLPRTRQVQATGPLRTFLEACPICDGAVEETTVVECCGGPGGARTDAPDEVLACTGCGARLYTF
jgi:hypothetical protein